MTATSSSSIVGILLEEISWEKARDYRAGGRGRENVLTAELLMGLDFLPRSHFLGAVIRAAQGADVARHAVATEVEELHMQFLPDDFSVGSGSRRPQLVVPPDAIFETTNTYTLVEAKRIRYGNFHPEQLAREYVTLMSKAGPATPMLLLLGVTPPLRVKAPVSLRSPKLWDDFLARS